MNDIKTINIKDIDLNSSYFHFTSRDNLESIRQQGLRANIGDASKIVMEEKPRVYMSKGGKGVLGIKNSFIHEFKKLRICDIPLEYRKYFNIRDFSQTEQVKEEDVYEAMEKRFKDEIYFKVDAVEGEDFLAEDFLPEGLKNEIKSSNDIRDIKGKENHDIEVEKLTLLTTDSGSTSLDIIQYLYSRLLENARKSGKEDVVRWACSDLDGLFEYIKQRNLIEEYGSDKKITASEATKNALKTGITRSKSIEANNVEISELNPENIREGETKDD